MKESEEIYPDKDLQQKKQIMESAAAVFQQHGFTKTSMDDIARHAGRSRTTLYKYYKNKDQLFEDFMLTEITAIVALAAQEILPGASLEERLISYNFRKIAAIRSKFEAYKNLSGPDMESSRHYNFFRTQFSLAETPVMKEIFRLGIAQHEIAPISDPELDFLISVITMAMRGIEHDAFFCEEDDRLHERLQWLADIMVKGLR